MKDVKIIGLNQIWARKNLDIGFFFDQILPQIEKNFQVDHSTTIKRIEKLNECDLFITFLDFPFYGLFLVKLLKPKKVLGLYRNWCKNSIGAYREMCLKLGIDFDLCEFNSNQIFSPEERLFCPNEFLKRMLPDPRIMCRDAKVVLDVSACSVTEFKSIAYIINDRKKNTGKEDKESFMTEVFVASVESANPAPEIPRSKNLPFILPPKSLGREVVMITSLTDF